MILSNKYSNDRKDNFLNKMMEVWIVNKKKITILACTLFMVMSLGACGKAKEDEDRKICNERGSIAAIAQ